jgi:hypothetical protein
MLLSFYFALNGGIFPALKGNNSCKSYNIGINIENYNSGKSYSWIFRRRIIVPFDFDINT